MGIFGKAPEQSPYYACIECREPIKLAHVDFLDVTEDDAYLIVWHTCDCTPKELFKRQFAVNHAAVNRLLSNLRPRLPYRAAGAGPHVDLHRDRERQIAAFRLDLEAVDSVEDFLLFCSRPPAAS